MKPLKRIFIFSIAVMFLFGALGLDAAQKRKIDKLKFPPLNDLKRPEVHKAQTANGIKLRLIKTDKLPLVDLIVMIKGGNQYDPGDKVGIADITAQLLRIGGAEDLKPADLDKLLDAKGITINITAAEDFFTLRVSCLKENFDEAVSILAKMLRQPAFDKDKLEEVKTQMASGISRRNDNPDPINRREFAKLIYGAGTPFAAVMEYQHLDNISGADVVNTYRTFFAPGNMLAGVTGPIDMAELSGVFKKHFGAWNHQARVPAYPQVKEQQQDFKIAFAHKGNLNQSYFSIGHLGVKTDLAMSAKFRVFNSIFAEGFSSRLMKRVRVKMGLTYGIGGGIRTRNLYPGVTAFSTFTKSKSTIPAIKAIFDEIDIIRKETVTPQELADAKDSFLNTYVFEFSSPDRVLRTRLRREFYGIDENIADKMVEDIKKVTAEDVLAVAKEYLQPEKMVISIVGNEKEIEGDLSQLGKVKKLDISIKPPAMKEKIPEATPEALAKGAQMIEGLYTNVYKGYKRLKSLESTSDMKMAMQGRSFEFAIKSTTLYPDKVYMEMTVMGMKITQVINGNKGVMSQMGQKRPMPEDQIKKGRFGGLHHIFHNRDKYKLQYLYEKEVDGKMYDVIYVFDAQKNWKKLFINQSSRYVEIEESLSQMPGATGVARTTHSDFRIVKGIPISFKTEVVANEKVVREITTKDVKVNPKVDPAIFKIEEKK